MEIKNLGSNRNEGIIYAPFNTIIYCDLTATIQQAGLVDAYLWRMKSDVGNPLSQNYFFNRSYRAKGEVVKCQKQFLTPSNDYLRLDAFNFSIKVWRDSVFYNGFIYWD